MYILVGIIGTNVLIGVKNMTWNLNTIAKELGINLDAILPDREASDSASVPIPLTDESSEPE
jgi:hypothetical protein